MTQRITNTYTEPVGPVLYLVNAQLAEQCVETVHLLALLQQKKFKNSCVPDPVDPTITDVASWIRICYSELMTRRSGYARNTQILTIYQTFQTFKGFQTKIQNLYIKSYGTL
jgi:hypothetical protein